MAGADEIHAVRSETRDPYYGAVILATERRGGTWLVLTSTISGWS
jgi:hypothetical protein